MKIRVVQHGKLKDRDILSLRAEYEKRFRRFGDLQIVERQPKGDKGCWPNESCFKVLVDERGETWDSPGFARQLQQWTMRHGTVAVCIGEAYGHDAATRATADAQWALGPLVLPHHIAHLVVVEQIYRAATILAGSGYHHG